MADKTVRYAPLQEAAKHTEVRQVSNPCHSLHPTALCIERLLPVPVLGGGWLGPRETVSGRLAL